MDKIATMPEGGYGPEFWRSKEQAFQGFKRDAMANGYSEERADAYIQQWREENDADVKKWSLEYRQFRAKSRAMFEERLMIPETIEKWCALVRWGERYSRFVGEQLRRADFKSPTLQMRQAVAYFDEAMQVANETEKHIFARLSSETPNPIHTRLNLYYINTFLPTDRID